MLRGGSGWELSLNTQAAQDTYLFELLFNKEKESLACVMNRWIYKVYLYSVFDVLTN